MILASHFSDELQHRGLIAMGLLLGAIALSFLAFRIGRPALRWSLVALLVLPFGAGVYRMVEVHEAHHNHLCHAHNSDTCGGHTHDEDGHTHRLGGWAAEKEEEL